MVNHCSYQLSEPMKMMSTFPAELRAREDLQDDKGHLDTATEDVVVHNSPDLLWPSGVLSVVVHQIVSLEHQNLKGTYGKRKGREFEPLRRVEKIRKRRPRHRQAATVPFSSTPI